MTVKSFKQFITEEERINKDVARWYVLDAKDSSKDAIWIETDPEWGLLDMAGQIYAGVTGNPWPRMNPGEEERKAVEPFQIDTAKLRQPRGEIYTKDGKWKVYASGPVARHALELWRQHKTYSYKHVDPAMIEKFLKQYVETALWASNDESDENTGGEPMDRNYDYDDVDEKALQQMRVDIKKFLELAEPYIQDADITDVAHDFWLTRGGHGTGFWDKEDKYGEENAKALTAISKKFPEASLYLGDPDEDGEKKIYYWNS